jgi:hypothetical protein
VRYGIAMAFETKARTVGVSAPLAIAIAVVIRNYLLAILRFCPLLLKAFDFRSSTISATKTYLISISGTAFPFKYLLKPC